MIPHFQVQQETPGPGKYEQMHARTTFPAVPSPGPGQVPRSSPARKPLADIVKPFLGSGHVKATDDPLSNILPDGFGAPCRALACQGNASSGDLIGLHDASDWFVTCLCVHTSLLVTCRQARHDTGTAAQGMEREETASSASTSAGHCHAQQLRISSACEWSWIPWMPSATPFWA